MEPKSLSGLSRQPEIARLVGLVVADYAHLEISMYMIFTALSRLPGDEAFRQFFSLRSLNRRSQLIDEAGERLPFPMKRALRRLNKWFKAAANRRTEIAHCSYYEKNGELTVLRLVNDEAKFERVTLAIFDRTFSQYRLLETALRTFLIHCVESEEAMIELLQSLPLARLLDKPLVEVLGPPPQGLSIDSEITAAQTRLGLSTTDTHVRVAAPQIDPSEGYR